MSEPSLSEIEKKLDILLKHIKNIEEHFNIQLPDTAPKKTGNVITSKNVRIVE